MDGQLFPEFTTLRPLFIFIAAALCLVLIIVGFQRKELLNLFSVSFLSIICCSVAAIALYASGYIVDAHNLGGDRVSFLLFLAAIGLSVLNIWIYLFRSMRR